MRLHRPWGTLRYGDEGRGPLVVLLHPLALSGAVWRRLVDDLSSEFRVVTPDARGHGESTWDGTAFSIPDLAADVAALVEHLDAGPAHLAALSMGGCTAVALAVRHPTLVGSLTLADTTADYGPDKAVTWAERATKAVSIPRERQLSFQRDRWFSPQFLEEDPAEVDRVSLIFTRTGSEAHAAACRAMGAFDDTSRLSGIGAPTRVIVGEDDYATPPDMAATLHHGIAGSDLHVLGGTRHLSLIESAEARELAREHIVAVAART